MIRLATANWALWKVADEWYTKIRLGLNRAFISRQISSGEKTSSPSPPLGPKVLDDCVDYLFKKNDVISVESITALLFEYFAMGRSGEGATVNLLNTKWNMDDDCLQVNWNMLKVSKSKEISFYHHYNNFKLDIYFSYACYSIVGAGKRFKRGQAKDDEKWLFPHLALTNGVTTLNVKYSS